MTPKQQRFVEEYLIDLNATQAAIRAGYSKKTAKEQGARLLSKVNVCNAIIDGKKRRSEKTGIDAAWMLQRLGDEAEADLAELYDEDGRLKPVHEWPLIWRQGLVAGIDVHMLPEGLGEVVKVKLADRGKRLEMLGRHVDVQAFKDRIEHSGTIEIESELNERRRQLERGK
ncbi:MAG: terminase small subunit [Gammaproteobacteria bacterium]|jgi:phage terminase small subunit|nr:terminase small subunit [Gammaproteobacteria bacterium]MBT4605757.1 terminase small subunit [Thiotrichales bacterium]MBT7830120.1 terminase small subunit [Candidatus Neomarinimicrobiota bacterium]MBT3844144.1 terminase small subunit [Gammaproteobacteria bacterium]MBT4080945.1 terminase small subunit [Gammaproteobacteria bacterium]